MGIEFVGGKAELAKNGNGEIRVSYARDCKIQEMMINSTGRVAITSLNLVGVEEYLTGKIELDQFKKYGNIYPFPEAIDYKKGTIMDIGLTDISGLANTVYIAFVLTY